MAAIASLGVTSYALYLQARRMQREEQRLAPPAVARLEGGEHTLHSLAPGDVVSRDQDYVVEGLLTFEEDGRVTQLYRLVDGAIVRWMGARPSDSHPLWLEGAGDLAIEINGPETVYYRGLPYRQSARRSVRVTSRGEVGPRRDGRMEFWEYTGPGRARIWALAGPSEVESFAGEELEPFAIELLPAS